MAVNPDKRDTGEAPPTPSGNEQERLVDVSIVYDDAGEMASVNMRFQRYTQDADGQLLQSLGVAGTVLRADQTAGVAQFEASADNFIRACIRARQHQVDGDGPFAPE